MLSARRLRGIFSVPVSSARTQTKGN